MTTFFTSDTHFNHAAILGFCRPMFKTLEEMNTTIIDRWNKIVKPEDTVYHIGDVAFGDSALHKGFVNALSGRKILIRGNHDRKVERMLADGFDEVYNHDYLDIDGKHIFMRHLPPPELDNSNRPWLYRGLAGPQGCDIWLCGHVHEQWKRKGDIINVGVDQWDFTPRTLDELIA